MSEVPLYQHKVDLGGLQEALDASLSRLPVCEALGQLGQDEPASG